MIFSGLLTYWLSVVLATTSFQPAVYILSSQTSISVNGTSTLHDWTMKMEKVDGKATFNQDEEGNLTVTDLTLTLDTEDLKSEHKRMDNIAYEAMKSKDHPRIIFKASELKTISKDGNINKVSGKGQLSIAGVTKTISLTATCRIDEEGKITCTGAQKIKMTDYGIDPPTAMLGTIKTGNDLKIVFNADFSQIKQ